jgi:hypothetical protein
MCPVNNTHSGRPTQYRINTHILDISAELGFTMNGGTRTRVLRCAVHRSSSRIPHHRKGFPKWRVITAFLFLNTACGKIFSCPYFTRFISCSRQAIRHGLFPCFAHDQTALCRLPMQCTINSAYLQAWNFQFGNLIISINPKANVIPYSSAQRDIKSCAVMRVQFLKIVTSTADGG